MGTTGPQKPWWLDPFGLPPGWKQARLRADRPLRTAEIWIFRLCLLAYPVVALLLIVKLQNWGGAGGALTPLFILSFLPRHQRRQVLGQRSGPGA
jgi:hypothetical protein